MARYGKTIVAELQYMLDCGGPNTPWLGSDYTENRLRQLEELGALIRVEGLRDGAATHVVGQIDSRMMERART